MIRAVFATALAVLLIACAKRETVLGNFFPGERAAIAALKTVDNSKPINITGKLVEKCPIAGCWFYLEDSTGRIKVDTKSAGFVVIDVPIGKQVEVAGIVTEEGSEKLLQARGIRF
jgi:uncharacterized protein YdeI (BOF family)